MSPGWYAIGFAGYEHLMVLAEYVGDGCWLDDAGDPLNKIWHPDTASYISIDGADMYLNQS